MGSFKASGKESSTSSDASSFKSSAKLAGISGLGLAQEREKMGD